MSIPTKGALISDIRNKLRIVNADYKLPNKYIWNIIAKHADWLIKEDSDRMRLIRSNVIFQTLKCIDVIAAPTIDDCCGIKSRCTVQRTAVKLPKIYQDSHGVIIKSVFSIDGSTEFVPITVNEYMRKLENANSKYDKGNYYYYNNGYLYFPKSSIRKIMVKALFEEDIDKYNTCDSAYVDPCKTILDELFYLPGYLLGRLMDAVFNDLAPTRQIPEDSQINKIENQ